MNVRSWLRLLYARRDSVEASVRRNRFPPGPEQQRDRRFQLRATATEDELIKVAADRQGVTVTEFIMRSACEKAEQAPADQTRFVLDEKRWKAFMEALDRPAKDKPRLRQLFQERHV
ncbi:MAG: DUF1778 domain-containing protein [Bryobacterales bacterium]|nr:DUF1778 domain-containing protein [Bryobacterales bacterium]